MINYPIWQKYAPFRHRKIHPELLSWLLTAGSLTKRLKQNCQHFQVQVLRQIWKEPFPCEKKSLGIKTRQWVFIREVKLICDGKPWVFARTIIPRSSLKGKNRQLLHLGNKPLGEILFNDPRTVRSYFEIAKINPPHYHYQFAGTMHLPSTKNHQLYGRRSLFYIAGAPILVGEVFTKEFPFY